MQIKHGSSSVSVHIEKLGRKQLNGLQGHNERRLGQRGSKRRHSNENIDATRTEENRTLYDGTGAWTERVDSIIEEHYHGRRKVRSDATLAVSITCQFGGTVTDDEEEQARLLTEFNEWLTARYPHVISAELHMDETVPGLHFVCVPLTEDGRLSAKELFNKTELIKLQNESLKFFQSIGPIHNFHRLSDEEKIERGGGGLSMASYQAFQELKGSMEASLAEAKAELEGHLAESEARVYDYYSGKWDGVQKDAEAFYHKASRHLDRSDAEDEKRRKEHSERVSELERAEEALRASESDFERYRLEELERLERMEQEGSERASRIDERERALRASESDFERYRLEELERLERMEQEGSERASRVDERERALRASETRLTGALEQLDQEAEKTAQRARETAQRANEIEERASEVESRASQLADREADQALTRAELDEREAYLNALLEQQLEERAELDRRREELEATARAQASESERLEQLGAYLRKQNEELEARREEVEFMARANARAQGVSVEAYLDQSKLADSLESLSDLEATL